MRDYGLGALLMISGCSAPNPLFEAEGGSPGTEGASSTGSAEGTALDGPGLDTSTDPGEDSSSNSGSSDDGVETDGPEADICGIDLYAINDQGQLYVIDVDEGTFLMVREEPELASRAIATDPETGILYVADLVISTELVLVHPFAFEIDAEPFEVPIAGLPNVSRAAFMDSGSLWLGVQSGVGFVEVELDGPSATQWTTDPTGNGGDMVFVDEGTALVLDDANRTHVVDFFAVTVEPKPVTNVPSQAVFTGFSRDAEGRLWAFDDSEGGRLFPMMETNEGSGGLGVIAGEPIELGIHVDDLAPVVVLPGDC